MLFSGKIRLHDVARLTARCVLFATICHYSTLFALFVLFAIRDYSLFAIRDYSPLFVLFAIRDYSLFAIRDYSPFAIRVFQTPQLNPDCVMQMQAEKSCSTEYSCVFQDPYLINQVSSVAQSQTHIAQKSTDALINIIAYGKVRWCDPAPSAKNGSIGFFAHFSLLFAEKSRKLQNKRLKTAINSMNFVSTK